MENQRRNSSAMGEKSLVEQIKICFAVQYFVFRDKNEENFINAIRYINFSYDKQYVMINLTEDIRKVLSNSLGEMLLT